MDMRQVGEKDAHALMRTASSAVIARRSSTLTIPPRLVEVLFRETQDSPHGCWGLIIGRGNQAEDLHRLVGTSAYCWGVQPHVLREVQEQCLAQGREVQAFYHSHTGEMGCPVILDAPDLANWPTTLRHVVISFGDEAAKKLRVFRPEGNR